MNATFFALAFTAALNPKLLALDLLLIENRRPRAMFAFVLLGAATVALTFGLVDVLTVHADAISAQKKASAGLDLGLGLALLAAGGLLATGRVHGRRREAAPEGGSTPDEQPAKKASWAARALAEPRLHLAVLIGALVGLPGASYLDALHHLIKGTFSTAYLVVAVVVFVFIELALIIIPFAFLVLRPEGTKTALRHTQDWLLGHALQLMAGIALLLGAYLTVTGAVRLA